MEKIYVVTRSRYDYFGGQQDERHNFSRIIDAWNYYKTERETDFDYGDSYKLTSSIYGYFRFKRPDTHRHGRISRSAKIQKRNVFSPEEIKYLQSFCVDDEDIII